MKCEECNQAGAAGKLEKHMRAFHILLLTFDTLLYNNHECPVFTPNPNRRLYCGG